MQGALPALRTSAGTTSMRMYLGSLVVQICRIVRPKQLPFPVFEPRVFTTPRGGGAWVSDLVIDDAFSRVYWSARSGAKVSDPFVGDASSLH